MADIEVLFTAQTPSSITYLNFPDNTFFEHQGELYFKVDDDLSLKVTSTGIEPVTIDTWDETKIQPHTPVVRTPAGVGFTLMQSAV